MLISDFARLGQVSVRMLRHYDAIGLLVPERVEASNGYRSYSPDQLRTFNRIAARERSTASGSSRYGFSSTMTLIPPSCGACSACAERNST
jgi:predicted metal-binding protein